MTLPSAPSSTDPTTFEAEADAFLAALPTFETEMNALAVAMNLNDTSDTSSSSVAIGTGSKTFTVTASKSFVPGMFLVIADSAAPTTNYMVCQVSSYSGTTLQLNSVYAIGSGTKTSWTISFSSAPAIPFTGTAKTLVHTGNGHGSTNTRVRRFTTLVTDTLGSYADSATLGATFTIPENGIYSVGYTDVDSSGGHFGVSINSAQLTTNFISITLTDKLCGTDGTSTVAAYCGAVVYLSSGDVLRCHTDSTMSDGNKTAFRLERLF